MDWQVSPGLTRYPDALARMEAQVRAMRNGEAGELVWLVEHPPLYTGGTSAQSGDLLQSAFPVYDTGRGGQYTYHGPGQRVAYLMLNLNERGKDVRAYVQRLERWIIATLAEFGLEGFTREGRIGVWVQTPSGGEAKIAALGVRVQGWVTSHGIALNVAPDLSHYAGIVPCGIREFGVTSLKAIGINASMQQVDAALAKTFAEIFAIRSEAA
jgi:lipoyl(octanoyl) transferase